MYFIFGGAFQFPPRIAVEAPTAREPFILQLRRESAPIRRHGEIVSSKSPYLGLVNIEFTSTRISSGIRHTGSDHLLVPSIACKSESCEVHEKSNISQSESTVALNTDGTQVPRHEVSDQVTTGFGTGEVTGEFVCESSSGACEFGRQQCQ